MGEIVVKILKYFITKVRLPRIAWVFIVGGVLFCLGSLGLKIYQSDEILINATDRFSMAVNAHERAQEAQQHAQQIKDQAYELHKQAQKEREEMKDEINKRLTEVIDLLENMKGRLKKESIVGTLMLPPDRLRDIAERNQAVQQRIETAQMDLRGFKEAWTKK